MQATFKTPALKSTQIQVLDDRRGYINLSRMYFGLFEKIASIKSISKIDLVRFKKWIFTQSEYKVVSAYSKEYFKWNEKKMEESFAHIILDNEIVVNLEDGCVVVAYSIEQADIAKALIDVAYSFKLKSKHTSSIKLIIGGMDGLDTTDINLPKPKVKLPLHYNDDLLPKHNEIVKRLQQQNKSGIYLFHGDPGTGKSTYIRYLVHRLKKEVVFMPPSIACNLDSPTFTRLLIESANTVFVIEDAEQLLVSREDGKNSSISMLLNITDGLLGESLGIQIIATFNTHLNNIDKALLRKGRLNGLYEFKPLTIDKSSQLLARNGIHNYMVNKPMTLAEIFNISQEDVNYKTERQPIGFLNRAV